MKSTLISISQIALLFFCLSCNKEENPCSKERVAPTYELSDIAKSYVNNYSLGANIIFKDISTNEDVVFNVESYVDTTGSYFGYTTCEEDTTSQQPVSGLFENIITILSNENLSKKIIIELRDFENFQPGLKNREAMLIFYGETSGSLFNYLEVEDLLGHKFYIDEWPASTLIDSLTIGSKLFYDVLEKNVSSEPFQPRLEIKYTKEEGIIYINDKINNRELVYDRKE